MANFNKVFLMGNLTRDPQLTYLPSQTPVVDFGLAVNRRWTDKNGEQKESTCFVDCRAFGRQAETINKYMTKGRPMFVEGRLDFDQWTAQDGTKRSKHRVTVESFQFVGAPAGAGQATAGSALTSQTEQGAADESALPERDPASTGPPKDDIPF